MKHINASRGANDAPAKKKSRHSPPIIGSNHEITENHLDGYVGEFSHLTKELTSGPLSRDELSDETSRWQELFPSSTFRQSVTSLVSSHYPCDHRSALDQVIALFLLYHPEHCEVVLTPLVEAVSHRRLAYSKKSAPFYALVNLFAHSAEVLFFLIVVCLL